MLAFVEAFLTLQAESCEKVCFCPYERHNR